jgi:hypothetical protein
MSGNYIAIQKLTHPTNGATVYLPEGQALPDTTETLERDGLVSCRRDAQGNVRARVHDSRHVRVLCWQLTVNADARRLGRDPVFTDLPGDLIDNGVQ